jgi:hypothetical protein
MIPPDMDTQEGKGGLIFPITTKDIQDNGEGVNAKWTPEQC